MSIPENIRQILFEACNERIDKKILDAKSYLASVNESVNDETKSTAGDKHETGRAMAQIEQEKALKQLNDAIRVKEDLERIDLSLKKEVVSIASVVLTDKQHFFISVPLGTVTIPEGSFHVISAASPVGRMMLGKRAGDTIEFNGNIFAIKKLL